MEEHRHTEAQLQDLLDLQESSGRVQLSHYTTGRFGGQQALLSPEASQELLTRVLEAAGAKLIVGAVIVEWDDDERPDIIVFSDGGVRELNPSAQPEKARKIVEAAQGRETAARVVAVADAVRDGRETLPVSQLLRMADHRPLLPAGTVDLTVAEAGTANPGEPWEAYEVGSDEFMAWDGKWKRFDVAFTWPSWEKCMGRVHWLNRNTDSSGYVFDGKPTD